MNEKEFLERLNAAALGIDNNRWALAELALECRETDFPLWAERIGKHETVRRAPGTVRTWARTANFGQLCKVEGTPFDFYRRAQPYEDTAPLNELRDMLETAVAENVSGEELSAALTEAFGKDKPHVSHNSGDNEWYTPPQYAESARRVMGGIDLDPASSETANVHVKAKKFYTKDDNGLERPWQGRVWMNPPYSGDLVGQFTEKFAESIEQDMVSQGIVLVNNATETAWFCRLVEVSSAVIFPYSRIKFLDPSGAATGAPLQGQAIVYSGPEPDKFLLEFAVFGWGAHLNGR